MKSITQHYIDGTFVESHGREVMDIINPTNGKVIPAPPARQTTIAQNVVLRVMV
jgi:acyl-CoA reductase-like NAD-dependent aldehyde dehydrogenase